MSSSATVSSSSHPPVIACPPSLPLPQCFFPSPTTMVASESLLPRVRPPVPLQFVAARETLCARVPICTGKMPIGCPKCSVRIHHSKRVCCPRVPEDGLADGMSSRRFCCKCGKCAVVADPHLCLRGGGGGEDHSCEFELYMYLIITPDLIS